MPKVIGVDLGTTNSCVAVMESGVPVIIPNAEGTFLTPSVVAINRNGERLVGEAARRQATINPENTIFSIKRFMGRKYEDPIVDRDRRLLPYKVVRASNGDAWVEVQGKQYSPPEISAMILQKLKNDAETYLGERVTQAVITVPAHFNNIQRQATKDAAKIAGLEILRIINEPTAASLAYGLDRKKDECIAVYSFGGGTFDISILQLGDGVFEVRSTLGDSHLGGDDFDQRIINWLADEFRKEQGIDLRQDRMALQRLKDGAEKAKKELSSMMQTEINLPFITADASGPKHLTMTLPRSQLEQLVENLVEKSRNPVMKALADADVRPDGINAVILTGGQTRMPAVQRLVRQIFNREPKRSINPDEAVAIGAAIQAGVLTGDVKDVLLLDVTPLSLGIETLGGVFTRLIEHNTTIPTQKSQTFSTRAYNNETFLMDPYVTASVKINVLQGEKNLVKDNQALGSLVLDNISFPYSGVPHIEVTFDIDVNGTMNVLARDNNPARGSVQGQKITLAVPKMKGRLSASLGIETFDGIFISLIERNTALPIQKSQIFALCLPSGSNQESLVLPTLPTLSQTSVEISILQGLERFTKDNHSLGSFILDNILPASPGLPQIEVTFDIDKNGNVKVSASGKNTGLTKSMTLVAETDQENHKLRDALGIQTLGGVFTPLTEHDITIPAQKTYVFSTRSANQPTFLPSPSVEINVLQGEREFAKDNRSLGSFILDGILLGPYGVPQLEITFDIDANDILDVEARDKGSGRRQKMTMVASSGLSKEQIDRMVREAERYAGEEKHRRIEIEERYLADSVAHQTEQSITQLGYKLITEQKNNLESRVSDVYTALASNDVARIVSAREVLEITIHHINEAIYRQESSGTVSSSSSEQSDHDSSVDDTIKNELLTALGVPEDKESRKPTSKLGDPEVALIQRMTPQIEYAFGRKDWFDVLRKVDYLIKRAPDAIPATIYHMQGLAFLERGEKQHALEALDIALALVNDDILRLTLLRDYTTILTSLEQWDMVVSFANEALQLVPNEPRWLAIQQEALAQLKLT